MSKLDWPGVAVGIAGALFLLLPFVGHWLGRVSGARPLNPGERALAVLLGAALLAFRAIWRWAD